MLSKGCSSTFKVFWFRSNLPYLCSTYALELHLNRTAPYVLSVCRFDYSKVVIVDNELFRCCKNGMPLWSILLLSVVKGILIYRIYTMKGDMQCRSQICYFFELSLVQRWTCGTATIICCKFCFLLKWAKELFKH